MAGENQDAMEFIWERIPKTKEGNIQYLPGDIPYLYRNGFVDTRQIPYQQWKAVFAECEQKDGTYLVGREKFLSLRAYRYEGPVFKPFDPARIREGEWTDEDLQKLFEKSIKPSSGISEDVFWNSVKSLKDQGLVNKGNLVVDQTVKNQLKYLIERFPSPRRRLETEVNRIREERESEYRSVTEKHDSSTFTAGKLASESKMDAFKKLENKDVKQTEELTSNEGIDIKKLRKPRGKIKG